MRDKRNKYNTRNNSQKGFYKIFFPFSESKGFIKSRCIKILNADIERERAFFVNYQKKAIIYNVNNVVLMLLNSDIVSYIITFLHCMDITNLKLVSKKFYEYVKSKKRERWCDFKIINIVNFESASTKFMYDIKQCAHCIAMN
jgi:hypothetical protein